MGLKQTILNLFAKPIQEDNQPMQIAPIDREELVAKLLEAAKVQPYNKEMTDAWNRLIDYLRHGNSPAPIFRYGLYGRDIHLAYWNLLGLNPLHWDEFDERVLTFAFTPSSANYLVEDFFRMWLGNWLKQSVDRADIEALVARLVAAGKSESALWVDLLRYVSVHYRPESVLSDWIIERVEKFHAASLPALQSVLAIYLTLLLKRKPDFVKKHIADFLALTVNYYQAGSVNPDVVGALLANNASHFSPFIVNVQKNVTDAQNYRTIQKLLAKHLPAHYQSDTVEAAYEYLEWLHQNMITSVVRNPLNSYEKTDTIGSNQLTVKVLFDILLTQEDPQRAKKYIHDWLGDCPTPDIRLFLLLSERLGSESVPFLIKGLQVDSRGLYFDTVGLAKSIFKLLPQYDYSAYYPQIWALAKHKSKQMREMAAVALAKLGEVAIPEAEKLLNDKKADARQTGALLLSLIKSERALALLRDALDNERNDDARDLMLDSLIGLLPVPTTPEEVAVLVEGAGKRGKLDAPVFAYLPENKLPALFWKTTGQPLTTDIIRFLFYRQSRSKDIRPDAEVRPLYDLIDRERSHTFAGAVLKAYFEAGADAKGKACLTIGGMLGGEAETDLLKTKVNQWAEGSRGKMAEYAVQALALIGSNRALRAVEFFSRKYKSKNKNIGAAANEAFTIAAETLGISPYDLADSIIPDFGFLGLFREFEAGGETFRAFVDTDFKLAFLNEDNKLIKTVPKAAPTVLKDEFKEIGKEIRDIVKAQSGRLEQYLVIQRKWPVDSWQAFFLGNPVMFAYAVRLIWGVFDANQNLLFTFQCQEDQTLLNADGGEIDLTETIDGDSFIGMVHPLSLTPEQITYWTEQLTDASIEPIFAQLNRRVVTLPETDRILKIDSQFAGIEYGGYGFVSKMDKLGWHRGSVQDGGWIASFYKEFSELGITAIAMQQGNISVGYYDENAALGNLMFVRNGSVRFGSYTYDDPDKDTDPRLIPFGEVPPMIYSEVMADLTFFKSEKVVSLDKSG